MEQQHNENYDISWIHELLDNILKLSSDEERSLLIEKYNNEHKGEIEEAIMNDVDKIAEMLVRFRNYTGIVNHRLMSLSDHERAELEETERIIDENQFDYYFQPIVNAKDGEIYSYEALMRPKSSLKQGSRSKNVSFPKSAASAALFLSPRDCIGTPYMV